MSKGAQGTAVVCVKWRKATISETWASNKLLFYKSLALPTTQRGGPALAHPNREAAPVESLADTVRLRSGEPRFSSFVNLQSYENKRDIRNANLGVKSPGPPETAGPGDFGIEQAGFRTVPLRGTR